MAEDNIQLRGALKTNDPAKTSGGTTKNLPVFGIVKDNIDPTCSGRIRVLIGDKSPRDPDNQGNWVTVQYLSNFFGKVGGTAGSGSNDNGTYKTNPSSYGEWHAPPDIGTKVICIFVNGDPNYGFYIGCVPEPESLHMVPAIGSSDNIVANEGEAQGYGGAVRLPVTNFNTNNTKQANSPEFNQSPRPVHSYTAAIMNQQGIIRDPIRGPISSSASRESVSRVGWGVSTPGRPIYTGGYDDSTLPDNLDPTKSAQLQVIARRGGHSIVMDDGDIIGRDQLIRIRTALGHQILMSDDGQTLMILHSNGQSYIELGKEGTIDMYSTNSVNIRTQGDLNLHADQNINVHAMEDLNFQGKNIKFNSEQNFQARATQDMNFSALGKLTGLSGGAMAFGAGGDASLVGGGQTYINGSKVNLNSGSPSTSPTAVSPIPLVAQTDTLYDSQKGFMAAPGKLLSITSRAPAHAPWANAGQGVDVKTNLDASANLPAAPTSAVQQTTMAAVAKPSATPPAIATVASAPPTNAISTALDKNTTSSMIASVASQVSKGPLAAAIQQGAAIVSTASGAVCAVGSLGLTPTQLAAGGILKPGASTLVNGLISGGANATSALTNNLFTGASGAQNLTTLVQNPAAQTKALVNIMQQAQTTLGAVGAITGAESPTQVAGLVTAAATCGITATLSAVQSVTGTVNTLASATGIGAANTISNTVGGAVGGAAGSLAGAASGIVNSQVGAALNQATGALNTAESALNAIGAGSAAATLASSIGGLGGISNALTALGSVPSLSNLVNQTEGVAASAFNAIKNSFKSLKANVPQNLTAIAKTNAASAATVASQSTQLGSSLIGQVSSLASAATGAVSDVTSGLSSIAGAAGSITNTLNAATSIVGSVSTATGLLNNSISGITGSISQAASTLSTIASKGPTPNTITTTIGGITGIASSVGGQVAGITSVLTSINHTVGGIQNAVNTVNAIAGAGPTITAGGLSSLAASAASIQSGGSSAVSSALASGMSNLPGGLSTAASIIDKSAGAVNSLPGLGQLSSAINNVQAAAMTGISAINGISNSIGSITNNLNGLSSLASAGLPVGEIAQLQSALSSLSSGGPSIIKLPTVGVNTTDRTSITSQIINVLGDLGIPMPNLVGGISQTTIDKTEALIEDAKKGFKVLDELDKWYDKIDAAKVAYEKAVATLPSGDLGINQAYDAYISINNDPTYVSLRKQLNGLVNSNTSTMSGTTTSITTNSVTTSVNENTSITGTNTTTLLNSVTGSAVASNILPDNTNLSTVSSTSFNAITAGAGSLSSDVNSLNSIANSLPKSNIAIVDPAMTASSLQGLQIIAAANTQAINNSIAGITGPAGLG